VAEADDGARVVGRLEQAVHELRLVRTDDGRGLFQADVGLQPRRDEVGVLVPPAGRVGLAGERQQRLAVLVVGDLVEREQVGHVAQLEAAAAELEAADLRPGAPDRVAGLVRRDTARLAQAPELGSEHDP
jgi:hypothetical protein